MSTACEQRSQTEQPAYKLAQIEGKGRGLVATRTLEVGELVFSEKAFLKAPRQATWGFYKSLFSRLEPDIQAKLMNLACPEDTMQDLENNKILLMKFQANCFELDDEDEDEAAVFEMLSMINHSCKSNVMWFTEEADKTRREVCVCRKIQEGEEIVVSYITLSELPLRQQRMAKLRKWGFECRLVFFFFVFSHLYFPRRCELCALSGEELRKDEDLRMQLTNMEEEYFFLLGRGQKFGAMTRMEQRIELMEQNWDKFSNQVATLSIISNTNNM